MILGLLLMFVTLATGARILAILPVPVKSHYVVMEPLLQALAARGHQVTVYSSFPQKTSLANFTDVDCSDGVTLLNKLDYNNISMVASNMFTKIKHLIEISGNACQGYFKNLNVKNIISQQFVLVITEMFANDCYVHFAYKLGVPMVSIVTMVPLPWTHDNFGLPDNPAYIPNCLTKKLHPRMDLYQRIINTVTLAYAKISYHYISSPKTQKLAEEYFEESLPWVEDIARSSSLLLVNSHFSLGQSRPLPPNVVDIGGIHIPQKSQLPEDLQEILDKSSQGVIFMSFGSMIRVSSIPKETFNIILRVFSKLPQTVLMKYEEDLPDTPINVITRKWFPQRDILEHKNVVAFVSHCGLGSVMEAVQFAKPVIGLPVFADQFLNINILVWKNAGVFVDLETITEEHFQNAVGQVLHNETILEGMKRLSQQFRDRPLSALQSAVYWTEYVLRHKGAPHLRPASTSLPFYQLWLLDVIAVLLSSLVVTVLVFYWTFKYCLSAVKKLLTNEIDRSKKKN